MELKVTVEMARDERRLEFLELEESFRAEGLPIVFIREQGWDWDLALAQPFRRSAGTGGVPTPR